MTKKIIIGRELSDSEIKKLSAKDADFLFLDNFQLPFKGKIIELHSGEKKKINFSTFNEIINLGDKFIGSNSVAQLLSFEQASIWHYHKFRTYFFIRNINYELKKLENIPLGQDGPIDFYCSNEFRFAADRLSGYNLIFSSRKKQSPSIYILLKYMLFVLLRIFLNLRVSIKRADYLFLLPERYSNILDLNTQKIRRGNYLLDYLLDKVDKKYAILAEVPIPKVKADSSFDFCRNYFETKMSGIYKKGMESLFFRYGFISAIKIRKEKERLEEVYRILEESNLRMNEQLAIAFIKSLHSSSIFYLWRYFAAKAFFNKGSYKAILATDENSPLTKSILDAAKFHGIKIIGMQHGTMHDLHPAYIYTKKDIQNRVIPDYTLVWGHYWKKFLIEKGNYPDSSIIEIGHLRTDIIPKLLENKQDAKTTFKLVFASQPQRDPYLRKQAAFDVFSASKDIPELELIVKLHPREYRDVDYYKSISEEAGCNNYTIDTNTDLYQLIASCDALITCFSTVGAETIYFNKPLIVLDHLKQDIQRYIEEGVAFQVTNDVELQNVILKLKTGGEKFSDKAYIEFIKNYAYKIDGNTGNRIVNFIDSLE